VADTQRGAGFLVELALEWRARRQQTIGATMEIIETIKEQIGNNPILLYMKGSPNQPQCGFSARTVQALMACGERFAYVDILANPDIRANLPQYANWPTFPQLWVQGELIGGCDIVTEMHESGELETLIKEAASAQAEA
jgi:monothiol glutaredoxin